MTADPYTGVRTRDNILLSDEEEIDDLIARVAHVQRVVAEFHAPTPTVPAVADEDDQTIIARQKQLIEDMKADWDKLNEFFNTTAQKRDWCSDYEARLHSYNQHFTVLRMVGRPRNWVGGTDTWKTVDGSGPGSYG